MHRAPPTTRSRRQAHPPRLHCTRLKEESAMPAGRKPREIFELVADSPGSPQAKQRTGVILANLAGQMTAKQACAALGVGPSRFFDLKQRMVTEWVQALEPKPIGRPLAVRSS